ncbi:MAG: hypothetical protein SNG02_05975 [Rikenellaceae bacterium]
MKKRLMAAAFVLMSLAVNGQDKFLVAGTSSANIAIVDKDTKSVEWIFSGVNKEVKECNSLIYLDGGNVAYTYKKGAYMVSSEGDVLWSYKVNEGEEMQSISIIKGGYMLGIAGNPMRIVELDKNWEPKREITFDTGVENIHRQFRQMAKTKRGTYLLPISFSKRIVELDATGAILKDIHLDQSSLYVTTDKKGDWIATTGHSGDIYKINAKSGELSIIVSGKDLGDGIKIEFGAGIAELKNGNYMLTNWVGHNGDQSQPILIELTPEGEVVWSMNKLPELIFAAAIFPISR